MGSTYDQIFWIKNLHKKKKIHDCGISNCKILSYIRKENIEVLQIFSFIA